MGPPYSCKNLSVYSSKSQTDDHKNEEPMTKLEGENVTEQREGDDGKATVLCSRWKCHQSNQWEQHNQFR